MAQISLYIPDAMMDDLRADAEEQGMSLSSYTRTVLENRHGFGRINWVNGWPPGYFDLYGSAPDYPEVGDRAPEPVESW